jgi:hypothetical protein
MRFGTRRLEYQEILIMSKHTKPPAASTEPDPLAQAKIAKPATGEKVSLGSSSGVTLSNEPPPGEEGAAAPPTGEGGQEGSATQDGAAPAPGEGDSPPAEDPPEAVLVPLLDTSKLGRTPRWRVLKAKKLHHQGQQIRFHEGQTFGADTFPAHVIEGFFSAGLQVERIE